MLNILYIVDHRDKDYDRAKRNSIEWVMTERKNPIEFSDLLKDKHFSFKEIIIDETPFNQNDIRNEAEKADVIVVDYGGMSIFAAGAQGLIDHWNRFFLKLIEEHLANKEWFICSAVQMYDWGDYQRLQDVGVKFRW